VTARPSASTTVTPEHAGSGILLLDKPAGLSSNAALQQVRRLLGSPRAGHVGSLDPLATGMLPICLGEATKLAGEVVSGRKRYRFTVALGVRTTTGDSEGAVLETGVVPPLTEAQIAAVLARFTGRQRQIPPMFSAIKHGGRPLYLLARAGLHVERQAREIEIDELICHSFGLSALELETLCSKGTYVRSLAEDVARALGTCGHVTQLRRLYVEPFVNEPMETLDAIREAVAAGRLPRILPADHGVLHLRAVRLSAQAALRVSQGQSVPDPDAGLPGRVRLYDEAGRFFGLGEVNDRGAVRPRRLFVMSRAG
jgi:tRNA pseudouridine55 synthase